MQMKKFAPIFSAVRFLTILPVPEGWCGDAESFRKSADWYPLVGLLIGLLAGIFDLLLCWLLPLPVASAILLTAMIVVTGALHMDGMADSADAFFSSRGRERMLEIMKDSCAGPMGVAALILLLLSKWTLLVSLPQAYRFEVIVLMPVCGRCAIAFLITWLPYARPEGGTAAFTKDSSSLLRVLIAWLALVFLPLLLLGWGPGLWTVFLSVALLWVVKGYYMRKIGGYTGDTLGAASEMLELVPALVTVAMFHHGVLV